MDLAPRIDEDDDPDGPGPCVPACSKKKTVHLPTGGEPGDAHTMVFWAVLLSALGLLCRTADAASRAPPSCLDRDGQPVDRWQILKAPNSYTYYTYESNVVNPPNWVKAPNQLDQDTNGRLMRTVAQAYGADPTTISVAMYSDEPPGEKVVSKSYAHAKGVLLTDGTQGFWVTHSMTQWPASPASGASSEPGAFPSAVYGQSLECITVSASTANAIAAALRINKVYIYYSQAASDSSKSALPDMQALVARTALASAQSYSITPITTLRGLRYTLFSKAPSNTIDIYDDLIAPFYQTALRVETWRNGAGGRIGSIGKGGMAAGQQAAGGGGGGGKVTQQYNVYEVSGVVMPDGTRWKGTQDHSKWVVAVRDSTATYAANSLAQFATCIGDMNRMCSQEDRGGGALCQTDQQFWNALSSTVQSVEPLADTAAACAGNLNDQGACYWCDAGYTAQPSARPTLRPSAALTTPAPSVDPFQVLSLAPSRAPVLLPTPPPPSSVPSRSTPRRQPTATPTREPTNAGKDIGGSSSSGSSSNSAASVSRSDPFANYHNLVFVEMSCVSVALGLLLCYARASLPSRVASTPDTQAFTIVHFRYVDLATTIPLSLMTAVANFIQVSALYIDAQDARSSTVTIDRAVAGGMVAVRVLVALVSAYLVDSSVRRSVWRQFVLVEYLQFPLLWVVVILVVLVDPSQVRLLPFMKSPFSEHSGGYPNLHVFTVCLACTTASALGIFMLSAASMVRGRGVCVRVFFLLLDCLIFLSLTLSHSRHYRPRPSFRCKSACCRPC